MTRQHPTGRALSPSERPADPSAPTSSSEVLLRAQAGVQPSADLAALRARIAQTLDGAFRTFDHDHTEDAQLPGHLADAVLAVLPDHAAVRAAALNEAADAADRIATAHREGEYGDELTSREVRDAIETVAAELRARATARPDDTTGA